MKNDQQRDVWLYSLIVVTLGLTAVSSVAGAIFLAMTVLVTLSPAGSLLLVYLRR